MSSAERQDAAAPVDAAYRAVLASLSEGLIVQFNTDMPGVAGTPELTVVGPGDDKTLLAEHKDAVPSWIVYHSEGDQPDIYENADTEWSDYYEDVVSIEVVGYDG